MEKGYIGSLFISQNQTCDVVKIPVTLVSQLRLRIVKFYPAPLNLDRHLQCSSH